MVRFTIHVILGSFPRGHVRSSELRSRTTCSGAAIDATVRMLLRPNQKESAH